MNTNDPLREALQLGLDYAREALAAHDRKYQRHPATEPERELIAGHVKQIEQALSQPAASSISGSVPLTKSVDGPGSSPAAPQEEPRLQWCESCGEGVTDFCRGKTGPCAYGFQKMPRAAPQGEAVAWQGLTDADINDLCPDVWSDWKTHARAIEAKLREKNTAPQPAKPAGTADRKVYESIAANYAAQPEQQGARAELIERARKIGQIGSKPTEHERLLFEAWMYGHCWAVVGQWDGETYKHPDECKGWVHPHAMLTRQLWSAWRDRAALLSAPQAAREPLTQIEMERIWGVYAGLGSHAEQITRAIEAAHGIKQSA